VAQIDGSKTANELPGIVDEVVTLAQIPAEDGPSDPSLYLPDP
jgi:hypothetical protein